MTRKLHSWWARLGASVMTIGMVAASGVVVAEAQDVSETGTDDVAVAESTEPEATEDASEAGFFGADDALKDPVTVKRIGRTDHVDVADPESEYWEASDEDIYALKLTGGRVTEVVKVVADGRELKDEDVAIHEDGRDSYVAFDLNALHTIPPMDLSFELKSDGRGEYEIAKLDEIPTLRDLEDTNFRSVRTEDEADTSMLRAAQQPNSKKRLTLGPLSYRLDNAATGGNSPRLELSTTVEGPRVQKDIFLTELVIRHKQGNPRFPLHGPVEVVKSTNERCTVQPENIKTVASGNRGAKEISVDLSSCARQIAVWEGDGNKIAVLFHGTALIPKQTGDDVYALELYGSEANNSTPAEPAVKPAEKSWNSTSDIGALTTTAKNPGDGKAQVAFEQSLGRPSVINGPIVATVDRQNGFDIDNNVAEPVLRIVGPNGEELFRQAGRVNETDGISPVDAAQGPTNGWAGVSFSGPRNLKVPAGSKIIVTAGYFKKGDLNADASTPLPLGPGRVTANVRPSEPRPGDKIFTAAGHTGFEIDEPETTGDNPYSTKIPVAKDSNFERAIVRVNAPNGILDVENYNFNIDQIEGGGEGVSLGRRVISVSRDTVEFEVFPVRNGLRIDSARVPKGATITVNSQFSSNPRYISAHTDIFGTAVEGDDTEAPLPPVVNNPDWLTKPIPNPRMPKRCGLRIAIVADMSGSLNFADTDGFRMSRQAAKSMVNSLKGTPSQVGIYSFGQTAGEDIAATDVNSGSEAINRAIDTWRPNGPRGTSTNWDAALKAVQGKGYDAVYFITDGMPTTYNGMNTPMSGAFVNESTINRAIESANTLKRQGTRVIPVMVDLTLAAGNVVERDYVLRDAVVDDYPKAGQASNGLIGMQGLAKPSAANLSARYTAEDGSAVNVEEAVKTRYIGFVQNNRVITQDPDRWSRGTRGVYEMGQDISGAGDPVRVRNYSQLTDELTELGRQAAALCAGQLKVVKRIVDEDGKVVSDREPGWQFTAVAPNAVIETGDNTLRRVNSKVTADGNGNDRGSATWHLVSTKSQDVTISETLKDGYSLYQRDDKNAVCTNDETGAKVSVENSGVTGFNLRVNADSRGMMDSVTCVVDNFKPKEIPTGEVTVEKAGVDDDGNIVTLPDLGGAEFKVYGATDNGEVDPSREIANITSANRGFSLDKVGTFYLVETKAPAGYQLLTAPIRFDVVARDGFLVLSAPDNSESYISVNQKDAKITLTVNDVRIGKMPKTGGHGVLLSVVIGLMILLVGAGAARRRTVN